MGKYASGGFPEVSITCGGEWMPTASFSVSLDANLPISFVHQSPFVPFITVLVAS
jgi:hypothetical protein